MAKAETHIDKPPNLSFREPADCSPNNDSEAITPTNVPVSPPIFIPRSELTARFKQSHLSPISGSFDHDCNCSTGDESPFRVKSKNSSFEDDNNHYEGGGCNKKSSTNELPLTELNLKLFTSEQTQSYTGVKMSTNELPLSDINFKKNIEIPDDSSLEVNWESENSEGELSGKEYKEEGNDSEKIRNVTRDKWPQHRSYSDPNILESEKVNKYYLIEKYNRIFDEQNQLSVVEPPPIPFSSLYCVDGGTERPTPYYYARTPSTLLSFFSAPPSRLTTSRSLSHPSPSLTGPSMSDSDTGAAAAAAAKRHRHSIAGQMSYFKMLGFGFAGPMGFKKLASANQNSLFSTAVITGSSSAPNLRDMIPSTASATGIEGFGGVPPIRPLETLHNALSLRQLDTFLEKMTTAPLYKTPSSTPPKYPSTPLPTPTNSVIAGCQPTGGHPPLRLQSPSSSWSGPPSFISSSSGPSSPGISDIYSNSKESSEMSSSVISGDGLNVSSISHMFPTALGLDQELENVGILLENAQKQGRSMEFAEYFTNIQQVTQDESGDVTPVSGGSEIEFNTNDATAGSTADCDVTVTEDIESSLVLGEDEDQDIAKSACSPSSSSADVFSPLLPSPSDNKILGVMERRQSESSGKFPTRPGSDKWAHSKEKFLSNVTTKLTETGSGNRSQGAVLVKEAFIEPPKINRISRSFHGQTNSAFLDVGGDTSPRRASDSTCNNESKRSPRRHSIIEKSNNGVKQLFTQKSLSESKSIRFTTTKVDEAEHAASMGLQPDGIVKK